MPSLAQMIVWIVVGLIGGGLASRLITWDREGFGTFRNLGLGLVGALIGGSSFRCSGTRAGAELRRVRVNHAGLAPLGRG